MADFLEEASQRSFVNISEILRVNRFESSPSAELLKFLEILFQLFEFKLKVDLLREENCHLALDEGI